MKWMTQLLALTLCTSAIYANSDDVQVMEMRVKGRPGVAAFVRTEEVETLILRQAELLATFNQAFTDYLSGEHVNLDGSYWNSLNKLSDSLDEFANDKSNSSPYKFLIHSLRDFVKGVSDSDLEDRAGLKLGLLAIEAFAQAFKQAPYLIRLGSDVQKEDSDALWQALMASRDAMLHFYYDSGSRVKAAAALQSTSNANDETLGEAAYYVQKALIHKNGAYDSLIIHLNGLLVDYVAKRITSEYVHAYGAAAPTPSMRRLGYAGVAMHQPCLAFRFWCWHPSSECFVGR